MVPNSPNGRLVWVGGDLKDQLVQLSRRGQGHLLLHQLAQAGCSLLHQERGQSQLKGL